MRLTLTCSYIKRVAASTYITDVSIDTKYDSIAVFVNDERYYSTCYLKQRCIDCLH